jgi:hypothetical protein
MSGNYYKLNEKNNLVITRDSSEATLFTIREANARIGTGRRARFYNLLEVDVTPMPIAVPELEPEESYEAPELDAFETPTMFDGLHNDWESMLTNLCYMSDHMSAYQNNLNQMLSDVDKEICDIMHYLEFSELSDSDMLKASRMLQERRRKRREIKDEMDKTALMRSTFLDGAFGIKVQQSLEVMEKMKERQYTPRKLSELFDQQQRASA